MSKNETIIVGGDHAGFAVKECVMEELGNLGFGVKDAGVYSADKPSDYPVYVSKVAGAISSGMFSRGIVTCGTGLGTSIVANRFPHVRATLCIDKSMAEAARKRVDSNLLVLAGTVQEQQNREILRTWLNTAFESDRYLSRLRQIDDNTRLNIALRYLDEINPKKLKTERVGSPFLERALQGFEKIRKRFGSIERRKDSGSRLPESCPAKITCEGRNYSALMVDISEKGAQFKILRVTPPPILIRDDSVVLSVKTGYGTSKCNGVVMWFDNESKLAGVSFKDLPDDENDPLRLLLDSM